MGEWLSANNLTVVCKGCVSVTCGRLAVLYKDVLRQSLVENWRLSVGGVLCQLVETGWRLSVTYMRQDTGCLQGVCNLSAT